MILTEFLNASEDDLQADFAANMVLYAVLFALWPLTLLALTEGWE